MTPSQKRKKGYEFAVQVAERLHLYARDYVDQIQAGEANESGADIKITGDALEIYPLAIECKFQRAVSIHAWYRQAERYRSEEQRPIVAFKEAQSWAKKEDQRILVCLDIEDFLKLIR